MGHRLVSKEFNRLNEAEELEVPCSGEVEDPDTTTEHDQFGPRNGWINGWISKGKSTVAYQCRLQV